MMMMMTMMMTTVSMIIMRMIFSDPTDLSRGGDSFVGKLRSNMLGTQVGIVVKMKDEDDNVHS